MNNPLDAIRVSALLNISPADSPATDRRGLRSDSGEFRRHLDSEIASRNERANRGRSADKSKSPVEQLPENGVKPAEQSTAVQKKSASAKPEDRKSAGREQEHRATGVEQPQPKDRPAAENLEQLPALPAEQLPDSADPEKPRMASGLEFNPLVSAVTQAPETQISLTVPSVASLSLMTVSDAVSNMAAAMNQPVEEPASAATILSELIADTTGIELSPAAAVDENLTAAEGQVAWGIPGLGQMPVQLVLNPVATGIANPPVSPLAGLQARMNLVSGVAGDETAAEVDIEELRQSFKSTAAETSTAGGKPVSAAGRSFDSNLLHSLMSSNPAAPTASLAAAISSSLQSSQQRGPEVETAAAKMNAGLSAAGDVQLPGFAARLPGAIQSAAVFGLPEQARGSLGQPQWHTAVAERVAMMASQRLSEAEIQLDPPELGQLHVRVTLNQEQANVSFVSHQAAVREALDQTAFRLREMFEAEGLNLVDVDVSDQSFHGEQQQGSAVSHRGGAEGQDSTAGQPDQIVVSHRLVDQFV